MSWRGCCSGPSGFVVIVSWRVISVEVERSTEMGDIFREEDQEDLVMH